jgi:hypothetical protein
MSQAREITATYVRSKKIMVEYVNEMRKRKETKSSFDPFIEAIDHPEEYIIFQSKYWFIMENDFPYDSISDVNHMIVPKRSFPFNWNLLNNEERSEFQDLREGYIKDNYDVIYENLPSGQTQPGRFHLHLLKLKRTSVDEFMNAK